MESRAPGSWIFAVTIEGITSYFVDKRAAKSFNNRHDEPGEIFELSKVDAIDLLNQYSREEYARGFSEPK